MEYNVDLQEKEFTTVTPVVDDVALIDAFESAMVMIERNDAKICTSRAFGSSWTNSPNCTG